MRARSLALSMLVLLLAAGCSKQTSAQTPIYAPSLRVGLLITTGGIGGDLAGPTIGAANVAADHLKQDHNVAVTLEQADYQGDLTAVPRMLADLAKKVDVIIVGTDDASVIPDLAAVSVPVIDAYLSSQQAGSAPNIFSLGPTDEDQARRLVTYLISTRKLGNLAVIFEETPYGLRGA
ncbi:MAG TPA: ABC transporter substrate-binding protein, partial [Actinomycetota bacterium]|nr:ABC transporter substrate-binding protein [Actinomycetota bacterium]